MPGCDKPTGGKTMHDTLIIKRINYRYFDIPLRRGSGETTVRIGQGNSRIADRTDSRMADVLPDKRTDNRITSRMIG